MWRVFYILKLELSNDSAEKRRQSFLRCEKPKKDLDSFQQMIPGDFPDGHACCGCCLRAAKTVSMVTRCSEFEYGVACPLNPTQALADVSMSSGLGMANALTPSVGNMERPR